jgi:hypothetical protein
MSFLNSLPGEKIERKRGPFTSIQTQLIYEDGFPLRSGRSYFILYLTDKTEHYIDVSGKKLLLKDKYKTMYGRYAKAKGSISRENYIKPYQITVTKKMREKGEITRYFAKNIFDEDNNIFEIKKQDFDKETNFYNKVSLLWTLKGKREKVRLENEQVLEQSEDTLKGMKYFLDPLQYYEEEETLTKHEKIQQKLSNLKY